MDDGSFENGQESGGSLRNKLEAALQELSTVKAENAKFAARDLIAEKGFKFVAPEDLVGVAPADRESKAAEIEAKKVEEQESLLRSLAKNKGLDDAAVDQFVKGLLGDESAEADDAASRLRAATRTGGTPPGKAEDASLYGPSRIRAAVASRK